MESSRVATMPTHLGHDTAIHVITLGTYLPCPKAPSRPDAPWLHLLVQCTKADIKLDKPVNVVFMPSLANNC